MMKCEEKIAARICACVSFKFTAMLSKLNLVFELLLDYDNKEQVEFLKKRDFRKRNKTVSCLFSIHAY